MNPVPVTGPVLAKVGPVYLRVWPQREEFIPPDDCTILPWAVGAMCRVTFDFGGLVTTKRMTQRFTWQVDYEPGGTEIAAAKMTVLDNLREYMLRHGFEPPAFEIAEATP